MFTKGDIGLRLGGPVFGEFDPMEWAREVRRLGYRAAVCPIRTESASHTEINEVVRAAAQFDVLIAEVGTWSNPISPDPQVRSDALRHCKNQLALADEVGARVCVNIAGSRGEQWDGPHPDNLSDDTFLLIVDTVREIIDAVQPKRTCYSLESMPWVYPDSPESYLRLIQAIDRKAFAVHLDPVNLINTPQKFYQTGAFLKHCFELLGPYIRSCHAKDIQLGGRLTVHLEEVPPGMGSLDYRTFLTLVHQLDPDTPVLLEHLTTPSEYEGAAEHIRATCRDLAIVLDG